MGRDAMGAVGEIVGALAVVQSIAHSAVQVNRSTRAIRSGAGFAATHSHARCCSNGLLSPLVGHREYRCRS